MGYVIGKGRENLDKIEQKTGATLKVWEWNGLCIKGSPESQKRAIREIKEQVVSLSMKVIRTAGSSSRSLIWSGFSNVSIQLKQRGEGEDTRSVLSEAHNEWTPVLVGPKFLSHIFYNATNCIKRTSNVVWRKESKFVYRRFQNLAI